MGRAEGQDWAAFKMMALVSVEKVLDAINWPWKFKVWATQGTYLPQDSILVSSNHTYSGKATLGKCTYLISFIHANENFKKPQEIKTIFL